MSQSTVFGTNLGLLYFSLSDQQGAGGRPKCPMDPYFIVPDKCKCVDFQVLHEN